MPTRTSTLPGGEVGEDALHVGGPPEARDHLDPDRKVSVALPEGVPVLLSEDRRRGQEERLLAGDRDRERGADGHLGLPEADVAADEAIHRPRSLEVLLDGFDRPLLVGRLGVREARLELLHEVVLDVVRVAGRPLTLRVEREELSGELPRAGAGARLDELPRLAAELRERGRSAVRAHVARHLADLLVRDVQPVVALEGEEEVVARDARHGLRLEAEELPDAVVLVDDVVARPQVGEALERAAEPCVCSRRPLPEDLRVGQQDESEVARDEAATRGRDGEGEAGVVGQRRSAGLEDDRLDPAEERLRPERLPSVGKGDDDTVAAADEAKQVALGLREAARGHGGALRLERMRLAARELVELDRLVRAGRARPRPPPPRPCAPRRVPRRGAAPSRGATRSPGTGIGAFSSRVSVGSTRSRRRSDAGWIRTTSSVRSAR